MASEDIPTESGEQQRLKTEYITVGDMSEALLRAQSDPSDETRHAHWESKDLMHTYDLFEQYDTARHRTYYLLDVLQTGQTDQERYVYWPVDTLIWQTDLNGTLMNTYPEDDKIILGYLRCEYDHLPSSVIADSSLEHETKKTYLALQGHIALGIALNQPEADDLIHAARTGEQIDLASELYGLIAKQGIELGFTRFQAAYDQEIAPTLFEK